MLPQGQLPLLQFLYNTPLWRLKKAWAGREEIQNVLYFIKKRGFAPNKSC